MKKTKTISTTLTDEDYEKFKEAWMDAENRSGERINVSTFVRDTIMSSINGDSPPSVQESKQEDKENVSPQPVDTFEKQSKEFDFNFDE